MQFDPLFQEYQNLPKIDVRECVSESDRYRFVESVFHSTRDQNLKINLFTNIGLEYDCAYRNNSYYENMIKLLEICNFDFTLTVHCISDFSFDDKCKDKLSRYVFYLYSLMIIEVCKSVFFMNSCEKIGGFAQMLDAIFRVGDGILIERNIDLLISIAEKFYKNDAKNKIVSNIFFNNVHLLKKCAEFSPDHSVERIYFEKWLLRLGQIEP